MHLTTHVRCFKAPHLLGTQHLETADAPELSPECVWDWTLHPCQNSSEITGDGMHNDL